MTTFTVAASTSDSNSQSNATNDASTGNIVAADLTSTLLSPGSHGAGNFWYVGCRFASVTVAQGATIASASFSLKAQATYSSPGTINLELYGHNIDNSQVFSTAVGDRLGSAARARTTATVASWNVKTVTAGTRYSVDVTAIVQEIVNRAGWVSGNALTILVFVNSGTTSGEWQDFYAWDDATDRTNNPPQLDITTGGATAPFPPFPPPQQAVYRM